MNPRSRLLLISLSIILSACSTGYVVNSDGAQSDIDLSDNVCETTNGDCTLTAAIQQANATNGAGIITFDGVTTITVQSPLPSITDSNLTIDGGGQVTLDGGQNMDCSGFRGIEIKSSSYNVIRGLTILNFGTAVRIDGFSGDARYNIIGYNPNSNLPLAAQRNVLGGNCRGVYVTGAGAHNNSIAANYVGTDASGAVAYPNGNGIYLVAGAHDNLVGGAQGNSATQVNDPVGHWSLDEASGSAIDKVAANNLTETSGSIASAAGLVGGARDFNAADSEYFMLADNADLSAGNISFSWSFWVNLDSIGSAQWLISKGSGTSLWGYEYIFLINSTGVPVFFIHNGALEGNVSSNTPLSAGQWHHIAGYYDAASDELGIAVDGTITTKYVPGGSQDTTGPLVFGAKNTSAPSQFFDGQMDEVSFWKRALNAQEISALYNGGSGLGFGQSSNPGRNVISGNLAVGIHMSSTTGNHISGNYIGTTADGLAALGNGSAGIYASDQADTNMIGFNAAGEGIGNVISANGAEGIGLHNADHNIVAGNLIGTTAQGDAPLGNGGSGIWVSAGAFANVIGTNGDGVSDEFEFNVISDNGTFSSHAGVRIQSNSNVVAGNYIGTDKSGMIDLGNYNDGLSISGNGNRIGTNSNGISDALETNVISGNGASGVFILGDGNSVRGNLIGTAADGSTAMGNVSNGVHLSGTAQNNVIGTDGNGTGDALEGNVISANGFGGGGTAGVRIQGDNNVVAGNYIGTDISGTIGLGNGQQGILISAGADGNRIGTDGNNSGDADERNVISDNRWRGLWINGGHNNIVAGNYIGTDTTGIAALPNVHINESMGAVEISAGATGNIIGTNGDGNGDAVEGNLISGNNRRGVKIAGQTTSNNRVAGNLIGTDVNGTAALPNAQTGVEISGNATGNIIGTNDDGTSDVLERNVISGNGGFGIDIFIASNNQVSGNYIGVDIGGANPLGNSGHGVRIDGSNVSSPTGNWVGGTLERANIIANNGGDGVRLSGSTFYPDQTLVLYNSIYNNEFAGINLQPGDTLYNITPNDVGDGDSGANDLMNYPVLSSALLVNNSISISGSIEDGLTNATFQIQYFANTECDEGGHGEGQTYLGQQIVSTSSSGFVGFLASFSMPPAAGNFITATATSGNKTSEFSACIELDIGQQLQGETPSEFTVIPNRNINCRYACTTLSDIADTLLEGIVYIPLGYDPQTGYFRFSGPSFGETCYAAPVAGGTQLMALELDGLIIAPEEISSTDIQIFGCPAFSTPTPTLDPDESYDATPTPLPQCSDGIDNDGDGRIDYVAPSSTGAAGDRECDSPEDNDESR